MSSNSKLHFWWFSLQNYMEYFCTHSLTHSHTHSLSLTHSHTHSLTHILTLTYSLTHSLTHSLHLYSHKLLCLHSGTLFISRKVRKCPCGHVRPAKIQISLCIQTVWSKSSLSAWRNFTSLAIEMYPVITKTCLYNFDPLNAYIILTPLNPTFR